ncbi:MAG: AraC family transcriptional regulator [Pseudomonas sp.]|nr:AraC family transcriptional regulator [Pseudomonas sp.]
MNCEPHPAFSRDFSQFWRIPEGETELLSARYSQQDFGRHSHDRYAIGVITHGVEKLYYRGAHDLGTAGSVVTITPGEIHDGRSVTEQGWMYRMLYIDPDYLNRVVFSDRFSDGHIHLFRDALTVDPVLANLFLSCHRHLEVAATALERETALIELLAHVFQRNSLDITPVHAREREVVRRMKNRIDEAFADNLSLNELGAFVGMDPLYMIRVFKNEVGTSPHRYQIQRRVAHAQTLLRSGMAISDASSACGFFDQSHLNRAFKKVVGLTPGHFKAALQPSQKGSQITR